MHPTHPPADLDPTPADILRGAITYLRLHGWHQGALYRRNDRTRAFPPACQIAAIHTAGCGTADVDSRCLADKGQWNLIHRATTAVALHLMEQAGYYRPELDVTLTELDSYEYASDWNDDAARTVADVIVALTAAATAWDRTHGGAQ